MNWDQIETKWAVMTRRMQPERSTSALSGSERSDDKAEIAVDGPDPSAQNSSAARQVV